MNIRIIKKALNDARHWDNVIIILSGGIKFVENFSETTAIRIDDDEVYIENDENVYHIDPESIVAIKNTDVGGVSFRGKGRSEFVIDASGFVTGADEAKYHFKPEDIVGARFNKK